MNASASPQVVSNEDSHPLDRAAARAAAQWLMRLHSEEATPADLEACQRWRTEHPEHERAWQRAERINRKFDIVPHQASMTVLGRKQRMDRRAMLKTLVLLMTAAPVSYVAWRNWEQSGKRWVADYHTATGELRDIQLDDGTHVYLNTASAMDVVFTANERRIVLHEGEILINTGADSVSPLRRPFIVQTKQGSLRALGTRFVVRHGEGGATAISRLVVLEGAVEITPSQAPELAKVIHADEQTRFTATHIGDISSADPHGDDWSRGVLIASSMRLGDFAAELNRYRPGLLRCDPEVAHLLITGAFQLRNTGSILAALPDTLPVSVVYRTRWWVTIVAPTVQSGG